MIEQCKREILRMLRDETINTGRVDGKWDIEAFTRHFKVEGSITIEALEDLIKENVIYHNPLDHTIVLS